MRLFRAIRLPGCCALLAAALAGGCMRMTQDEWRQLDAMPAAQRETLAVYDAVLERTLVGPGTKLLVVSALPSQLAADDLAFLGWPEASTAADADAMRDAMGEAMERSTAALAGPLCASVPVWVLDEPRRQRTFRGRPGDWGRFFAACPQAEGLAHLSCVLFSEDGEQALVHVVLDGGSRAWRSGSYRLRRVFGVWIITATHEYVV